MSFIKVPTVLHLPYGSGFAEGNTVRIWSGTDKDSGYFAYQQSYNNLLGSYIIADSLTYKLKIGETILKQSINCLYNGYPYWSDGAFANIIRSETSWIYTSELLTQYPNTKTEYWQGELPTAKDGAFSWFYPMGVAQGQDPKKVEFYMPRWTCDTQFGVYQPSDSNVSGTKVFGVPRFTDNQDHFYTRSSTTSGGNYTYSNIAYKNGKWIIGEENSASGWFEGEEPNLLHSVTFKFCKNAGSSLDKQDLTLTLKDYVQGTDTINGYLGEVAIWR